MSLGEHGPLAPSVSATASRRPASDVIRRCTDSEAGGLERLIHRELLSSSWRHLAAGGRSRWNARSASADCHCAPVDQQAMTAQLVEEEEEDFA